MSGPDAFLTLLGLAHRARKTVAGQDRLLKALKEDQVLLVVMADDAGAAARRKILAQTQRRGLETLGGYERRALAESLGMADCSMVGITDQGLAAGLKKKHAKP